MAIITDENNDPILDEDGEAIQDEGPNNPAGLLTTSGAKTRTINVKRSGAGDL